MSGTVRETVQQSIADPLPQTEAGEGCLLQIHPFELNSKLAPLVKERFVIGRDSACDLCVQDTSISRRHAVIWKAPLGFVVEDLKSTNGTWVNEQPIESHRIVPGDRLRIGGRIYKFLSTNHIEAQYHEAVYSMMTRDSLTGAWNQWYFLEALERELARGFRLRRPVALILLDLDFFKAVNDQHGHLSGDEVLRQVRHRLGSLLSSDDVLARYGGEEFTVVLSECSQERTVELAETMRRNVAAQPFSVLANAFWVTLSIGVAVTDPETEASQPPIATDLIELADQRLYQAKRSGRNRVCW